jgi:hypothetical protein
LSSKYKTYIIRGTLYWAKVLGAPIMNDYAKARQWSVDVTPDEEGLKTLKTLKLTSKLKESKNPEQGEFISFRQNEFKKSGEENEPITITDIKGNPWPSNKKLGNGTIADVKFSYIDFGTTKGNYIKAIRVLKHVPYIQKEFDDLDPNDDFYVGDEEGSEPKAESDAFDPELDDDVPF